MIAALLFLATPLAQDRADPKREAEARDAIVRTCHIPAARLAITAGEDDSYDVLVVKGSERLSDGQLRCYGAQLSELSGLWPQFEDDALGDRYSELNRRDRHWQAHRDLHRRGLLTRLPRFAGGHETLKQFAVRLERLCDTPPHSALVVRDDWIEWAGAPPREQSFEAFARVNCAINAATLAGYDPFDRPMPPIELPVAVQPPATEEPSATP